MWADHYFRPHILGHCTAVCTDYAACTSLLNSAHPSGKLARWVLMMQEMDLVIKHQSECMNTNAGTLTQNPTVGAVESLVLLADDDSCVPQPETKKLKEIRATQRENPDLVCSL